MSDRRGVSIPILLFLSHWSFESRHFFQFCLCDFFSHKFLLRPAASSFSSLKVFTIVLGGTAALHAHRAWGAVLFWAKSNDEVNDHAV